ncbi:DUF3817 domain-containing protein, partial [Bacillus sp. SS-TM]
YYNNWHTGNIALNFSIRIIFFRYDIMAHGVLFILFIFAVIQVTIVHRKSILWALGAFVSSVIPFGTFVLDAKLKNEQQ